MTAALKLSQFESALVEALPAGDLRALLGANGLPHRRVEAWKWSDLRTVVARFPVARGSVALDVSRPPNASVPLDREPALIMPRLAATLGGDCAVFELSGGEPLTLELAGEGVGHRMLAVSVPAGVTAVLYERYRASPGAFTNIALNIVLGEGAHLTRIIEQDEAPGAVLVVTSGISLSPGATLHQTTLAFGAQLARLETHVSHPGEGAHVTLDGAYLVSDGRHLDQTTLVHHTGPGGRTSQVFKGATLRNGRGVFQGKIKVDRLAQKTDAQMQHRGLLLDESGEIDSKPELEIYADDVVCAHGNALGAIDTDALFYMRQRGLPEALARSLLTRSFLAEPLLKIEEEAVRTRLLAKLGERLEAHS